MHDRRVSGAAAILLGMAVLLAVGCGRRQQKPELLARVGSREITLTDLEAAAGLPAESLSAEERVPVLEGLIARRLVEQEGVRRGLDRDPAVKARLDLVRADLFLARLLGDLPAPPPSDSLIQAYYEEHQQEFLRPVDSFLLELYWGEDQGVMNRFRNRLPQGDTMLVATGDVAPEGRWLTEAGELERDLERELSSLEPGEVTFPRPYEDGWRVARLLEVYPAGTVLDLSAVQDEIAARLMTEQSRRRQETLLLSLRERFPVQVYSTDSLAGSGAADK